MIEDRSRKEVDIERNREYDLSSFHFCKNKKVRKKKKRKIMHTLKRETRGAIRSKSTRSRRVGKSRR